MPLVDTTTLPAVRSALRLRFRPLEFLDSLSGQVVAFKLALVRQVLVAQAQEASKAGVMFDSARAFLGDGLITSNGPLHMRQRRLMQPAFHPTRIAAYATIMREAIAALVDGIVAGYRADGVDHGDLLSMLLSARDPDTGEAMSNRQVHDECLSLFIASVETTARAMCWVLHAEVDEVLGGRAPERSDLDKLPDRWLPGHTIPRHSYLPFGAGARQCIGNTFAFTEIMLLIGALAGRWRLRPAPGKKVRARAMTVLYPHPLHMIVEPRR